MYKRQVKNDRKAAAIAVAAAVCASSVAAFAVFWVLAWYGGGTHGVVATSVAVDLCCRAVLPRILVLTMTYKSELRQMEVMRAIESSSTYKVRLCSPLFLIKFLRCNKTRCFSAAPV